ncbi:MAG: hypothetical protein WC596_00765 [Candidatus Shapirobacteria bacterium]
MKQIIGDVVKGLVKIGEETGKEMVSEAAKIGETIISGEELLGDIKPMTEEEMAKKKMEEERKKQEELQKLRLQMQEKGRNVEEEVRQIREEKEKEEQQEKQKEMEEKRRTAEEQQKQAQAGAEEMTTSTNPAKQKKSRGSAFVNKKKQQPDQSQLSQTQEFKGKID